MTTVDPAPDVEATRRAPRLPGDADMWVMVLGDLFFFGCYFVTYMVFRAGSADEFAAAQQRLHVDVGVLNTIVLLTSSMFVALAVVENRHGRAAPARRLIRLAGAGGVLFALIKVLEWHAIAGQGHGLGEEFFSFYFILTGIHLVHLALGLIILGVVDRDLRRPGGGRQTILEQGALFWHMIDLLWVVIFAMLYLMR